MKKNYIHEGIEVLDQGNEICMKFIPNNSGQALDPTIVRK
jgi:hypothetical protein